MALNGETSQQLMSKYNAPELYGERSESAPVICYLIFEVDMNKKDCENIGLILSEYNFSEEVLEDFFRLDVRIRSEYELFSEGENQRAEVEKRAVELMAEKFGHLWACRKAGTKEEMRNAREQAAKEIYGDDYHPSLLR